jgi:C4-dicarboxylate-binding protein DctP
MMILATPYLFANDEEGMHFVDTPFFTEVREKMAVESACACSRPPPTLSQLHQQRPPDQVGRRHGGHRMRVPPSRCRWRW